MSLTKQILAIAVELLKEQKSQTRMIEDIHRATVTEAPPTASISLADIAEQFIGVDASPNDIAPDELGCAESVSSIVNVMLEDFKIEPATWLLKDQLDVDPRFERVMDAQRGDIIMSPTFSGNGKVIGHTGIFSSPEEIMSNVSASGTWEHSHTLQKWVDYYRGQGALKIYFYRFVG